MTLTKTYRKGGKPIPGSANLACGIIIGARSIVAGLLVLPIVSIGWSFEHSYSYRRCLNAESRKPGVGGGS